MVTRILAVIIFILFSPLFLLVGLVILFTSGRPIFFRQKRTGKNGRPFTLIKFRTMVNGADKLKYRYRKMNEARPPSFKIYNDPRFTPIGSLLSHTGLDELPQLLNIIKDEMSFIGPRPLPIDEAGNLLKWQKRREKVLPGIISPWVLDGYHRVTFAEWMRSDINYAEKRNFRQDLILAGRAVNLVIRLVLKQIG